MFSYSEKNASAIKLAKKNSNKSSPKGVFHREGTGRKAKRKNIRKDVLGFRWLKKTIAGKTQEESLDPLDQWILKNGVGFIPLAFMGVLLDFGWLSLEKSLLNNHTHAVVR